MVVVDPELCTGCRVCSRECPTGAIRIEDKLAVVGAGCVDCGLCARVCEQAAVQVAASATDGGRVQCDHCPVQCNVPDGFAGACRRYVNRGGLLELDRHLLVPAERGPRTTTVLEPLVTGVGAGTTSPCFTPAPYAVEETIDGIDVVTVVSEVPLSYSNLKVKVDTNVFVGEEGARIRRLGRPVGHVETEEYGSKMLAIGGVNTFHGRYGSTAARTIADICGGKQVALKIEEGARVEIRLGEPPKIDGVVPEKMRVGCGSATLGMFAPYLKDAADEAIVLDPHITGLLSEHLAGRALGLTWSGVVPVGTKSTIGRYFGTDGTGLGGTAVATAREAVAAIDMNIARPGMTILVTDTAGDTASLFRLGDDGELDEIDLTDAARRAVAVIRESSQASRVSALLMIGVGGSARAGVTKCPVKLNEAVHAGDVRLTVGGAPVFLLPGGGITAAVDVERIPAGAIGWVPTPCVLAPVEYTMTKDIFARVEGHLESLRTWRSVAAERAWKPARQSFGDD
jgi:NAD-dependent dihydropyrimidine dehydrogenase PreA subunit